jgi:hypothetical protein
MKLEQAELTAAVAKQDKLLAQQFHFGRPRFRAHNFRERDRPPITPQHLAGRRAGPNAGHEFVFFFGQHLINPSGFSRFWSFVLSFTSQVLTRQAAQNAQRQGARKIDERKRTELVRCSETIERNDRLCENSKGSDFYSR